YTHDTNVFRRNDPQLSDNILSAGVLGGFHWRPGRQHTSLDGAAAHHTHGDSRRPLVAGALAWAPVERRSGSLRSVSRQALGDFAVAATPTAKNVERNQDATGSVRYGLLGGFR